MRCTRYSNGGNVITAQGLLSHMVQKNARLLSRRRWILLGEKRGITTDTKPVRLRFNELQREIQFISNYHDLYDYVTLMRSARR